MRFERRARIAMALGVLITIVIAIVLLVPSGPPEPSYNGKTLTQWLDQYAQARAQIPSLGGMPVVGKPPNNPQDLFRESDDAIRHIGSNAVPTLVKLVSTRDSTLKRFLTNHISQATADRLHFGDSWHRYSSASPEKGNIGFIILGPVASNAVPGLIEVLRTTDNPRGHRAAMNSLACIGGPAYPALPYLVSRCLQSPDLEIQTHTYGLISWILKDSNQDGRRLAIDLVLPPLIDILKDPKADPNLAISILGEIGPEARVATPALVPLLDSTNISAHFQTVGLSNLQTGKFTIGSGARRALEKIEPAAIK